MSDTYGYLAGQDSIEERKDLGEGDAGVWRYWQSQERIAEKEEGRWPKIGRAIVARYRDQRSEALYGQHRFNILWSNVQTLLPAYYARVPKAEVERRFLDNDETGRLAATLLERAISYTLDPAGGSAFDSAMKAAVLDQLLPGRGVCRVMYVPSFGDELPDQDEPVKGAKPLREVTYEELLYRYTYWEDYREGPARTWEEVPWIRYRSYMMRSELVERFGAKIGKKVKLDFPKGGSDLRGKEDPPPDLHKKACIHEYWDKCKRRVVWLAPGTPDLVLDEQDDPLELPGFFPSPDPLLATTTTDNRIPVPDYVEYRDQAAELDRITTRIDLLTRAMKVSGVYPGDSKQVLQQLIDAGTENKLIPVEDWVAFMDKGGLQNMIQWMPLDQIAKALLQLYDARDRTKSMLYEVTGIGDILRGETVPNETAAAQTLKSNFATRRIVPKQREVARMARDLIRLAGAVIAGHFSAQTLSQITGYPQLLPVPQLPPAPPQFLPAPMQPMQQPGVPGQPMMQRPSAAQVGMPLTGERLFRARGGVT